VCLNWQRPLIAMRHMNTASVSSVDRHFEIWFWLDRAQLWQI
jgi:hypothetical protein